MVVVAGSISLVVLVLLVAILVLRGNESDALFVATGAHWAGCTQDQAGQEYQCMAAANVTNQGGSRGSQIYRYLAFYLPDGSGCVDIPQLDAGASRAVSCQVQFASNFPSGSGPGLAPTDPPRAIVRTP